MSNSLETRAKSAILIIRYVSAAPTGDGGPLPAETPRQNQTLRRASTSGTYHQGLAGNGNRGLDTPQTSGYAHPQSIEMFQFLSATARHLTGSETT